MPNSTICASNPVEFVVVGNGQEDVSRCDDLLLVVASSVAGQLQHLGTQVLQHGRQVDGSPHCHPPLQDGQLQIAVHSAADGGE